MASKENCIMTVSGNPGTGNITIGSAVFGAQALGSGEDGQTFTILIYSIDAAVQSGAGLWEVHTSSTWTNSTKTLSRSAGTVIDGSSGPATLVNFSSGTQRVIVSGITENNLSLSDVTTSNVSTTKHGFSPKAPNDATKYLDGTGAYSTPATAGSAGGDLTGSYPNPTIKSGVHLTGQVQVDAHYGTITADSDATTITFNMSTSDKHSVTIAASRTFAASNDQTGQSFVLFITQGGSGSNTVTWWSGIKWQGGTVPTLTTTAGKMDVFSFIKLGTGNYLGMSALNF